MRKRLGFTLIEALISVLLLAVFVGVLIMAATRLISNPDTDTEARTWATKMGLEVQYVSCNKQDTDGDGYVSCTISSKHMGGSGPVQLTTIECATRWSINEGCKMQKVGNTR